MTGRGRARKLREEKSSIDEQRMDRLRGIAARFADPIIVRACIRGRSGPGLRNPSRQDGAEPADGRGPVKRNCELDAHCAGHARFMGRGVDGLGPWTNRPRAPVRSRVFARNGAHEHL
ncbi:hypothetical protein BO85DRAFT_278224 [Aspergillus piperis CBS 112811]|uniref:Uncharacterized protein n=1 Tax=Aspergillus piperis CBS 112811 TaxID=1448313 RepID=A0A8G1R233_9EURO|nr:hypothetical protein BO85DRAFT_278224 [Aspergillus piperis CBS 112811]RAH58616.1 hypothetical protein BO85DRAFT_278224 [Aspergillus piperis CBS 112811]